MFISIPGYLVCYFKFRELFTLLFEIWLEDCQGWPKPKTYNSILRGGRKLFTSVEPLAHLVSSTNHSASVLDQAFLQCLAWLGGPLKSIRNELTFYSFSASCPRRRPSSKWQKRRYSLPKIPQNDRLRRVPIKMPVVNYPDYRNDLNQSRSRLKIMIKRCAVTDA